MIILDVVSFLDSWSTDIWLNLDGWSKLWFFGDFSEFFRVPVVSFVVYVFRVVPSTTVSKIDCMVTVFFSFSPPWSALTLLWLGCRRYRILGTFFFFIVLARVFSPPLTSAVGPKSRVL